MVILKPKDVSQVKTIKQQALITRLLQSRYFSKREFIELMKRNRNQVITSYDASVLIGYIIASLRFRKKFLSKRHKAHLKCDLCSARKSLTRYYVPSYETQKIMCFSCEDKYDEYAQDNAAIADANAQKIADDHATDHKIEVLKAAQDFDEEVKLANSSVEKEYDQKQQAKAFVKDFNKLTDVEKMSVASTRSKPSALQ